MVKLNDYAYSKHFINHKVWFTVSFISEHQWINFWNDSYDGTFIDHVGLNDAIYNYVPGTCKELDNAFLTSTGCPRSIKFNVEFERLVDRN